MSNDTENKLSKVLWRCPRGMLELDMMLQRFCETVYSTLSPEKQQLFEDLLEEQDQDLQRWLTGGQACDKPRFQDMLLVIRHMHRQAQSA
ncbi:MAG TPA: succinate dehydrogenase assembly factor 2 [Gammaproteobacteria bacterium]|nr:succinate dehydrogenase assembly factor 2 [Gammaproteobacteria bacterium]